jgi:hypothetical protein
LEGLPAPYIAGILSSNTVRTSPPDLPGYVQSSIGVIRLGVLISRMDPAEA